MAKITAIHSGGDWSDASANYLVLPDHLNIQAEKAKWDEWYRNEYCAPGANISYVSFYEKLKQAGAREATPDELEIFYD